jgi:hypothetical protein
LKPEDLFIHYIGFYDHFASVDSSISSINFLQFNEKTWNNLAGNRFMYHNRMRLQEHIEAFHSAGLEILGIHQRRIDEAALSLLEKGFPLDKRFQHFDNEMNATSTALLIARC